MYSVMHDENRIYTTSALLPERFTCNTHTSVNNNKKKKIIIEKKIIKVLILL